MDFIKNVKSDLQRLKAEYGVGKAMAIFSNRGFHALLFYRLSHALYHHHVPVLPLVLTRVIQIFYAVDIDYKAKISGGLVILHGVGLVIGQGTVIMGNCTIYHGVTLGRKKQGVFIPADDGYPIINHNCLIGAGAKIIGPLEIGAGTIIGPNCVITSSIPANVIVKVQQHAVFLTKTEMLVPLLSNNY